MLAYTQLYKCVKIKLAVKIETTIKEKKKQIN